MNYLSFNGYPCRMLQRPGQGRCYYLLGPDNMVNTCESNKLCMTSDLHHVYFSIDTCQKSLRFIKDNPMYRRVPYVCDRCTERHLIAFQDDHLVVLLNMSSFKINVAKHWCA